VTATGAGRPARVNGPPRRLVFSLCVFHNTPRQHRSAEGFACLRSGDIHAVPQDAQVLERTAYRGARAQCIRPARSNGDLRGGGLDIGAGSTAPERGAGRRKVVGRGVKAGHGFGDVCRRGRHETSARAVAGKPSGQGPLAASPNPLGKSVAQAKRRSPPSARSGDQILLAGSPLALGPGRDTRGAGRTHGGLAPRSLGVMGGVQGSWTKSLASFTVVPERVRG